jgi:hypothetical protein
MKITLTTERKVRTGKVTYKTTETEVKEITEKEYKNIEDSIQFFRRLGGIETVERYYTCRGYNMTKLSSTSPSREIKTVRKFEFN